VAWTSHLKLWLAQLARARVRWPRRGLVGLASYLGLERLWLGMGARFMGRGQPVCWCLDRRNCRSSGDRGAAADLRRTAADCCRTSVYLPATDRIGATRRCSFCTRSRAAAGRPAARRDGAATDRGPAAPEIIVAVAPPLIIFTPPAFAFFIGPPFLAFATMEPGWWDSGYVTGGFAGVGVGAAIAHFGHTGPGFAGMPRGVHAWPATRSHWASTWHGGRSGGWHGGGFGGWHGGGFGGWHGGGWHGGGFGGWHEARGGGGFGGGHGHGR
jgi:hypothetical protein